MHPTTIAKKVGTAKKTVIITIAKNFLIGHPKQRQPTDFQHLIETYAKIHTIRLNYDFWSKQIQKVINDQAILSIRSWSGPAYKSKQKELFRLTINHDVGYQQYYVENGKHFINGKEEAIHTIARNDGLSVSDFNAWFDGSFPTKDNPGIIIHFTGYRYNGSSPYDPVSHLEPNI